MGEVPVPGEPGTSRRPLRPGELAMIELDGPVLTDADARFIGDHGVRAVCLFSKNFVDPAQTRRLTRELRQLMGPHALLAVDQEGGTVVRTRFGPHPPAAMALGAVDDEALAEDVGAAVGGFLRGLGLNWVLAPVLDLATDRHNPVTGLRSFGADPARVAVLAGAWMRGAHRAGVATCIKHFPGHGSTSVDSHVALPRVERTLDELQALELLPFARLRQAAPALMTAHIVFPAVDPEAPATLSPVFLRRLLRGEWGYDGVILTDSLWMDALRGPHCDAPGGGLARTAEQALAAGADLVALMGPRAAQAEALGALDEAFGRGRLSRAEGQRSRDRLEALARRYPAGVAPDGDVAAAARADDVAVGELMACAASRALACRGDPKAPPRDAPLRVVMQRRAGGDGVSEPGPTSDTLRTLFAGFADVEFVEVDDVAALAWSALPADGRRGVLVSSRRTRSGRAVPLQGPDLHLVLWNPYEADEVDAPAVITWGFAPPALHALRQWLHGGAAAP